MKPAAAALYMSCIMALVACSSGFQGQAEDSNRLIEAAKEAKRQGKALRISYLGGGSNNSSFHAANMIDALGVPVVLDGQFLSSSVAILSVKNLCYTRSTSFWFHASYYNETWANNPDAAMRLRTRLPGKLVDWIKEVGAQDYRLVFFYPPPPAPDESNTAQAPVQIRTRWTSLNAVKLAPLDFKPRLCTPQQLAEAI